jgi:hypothetical protein
MSDQEIPLPPASFEFLIWSMRMQAESSLGAAPWAGEHQEVNLPLARHSIDMLAMLQDKTRNNLTLDEQRLLDNSVTELRFRFIQASEAEQKKPAQAPAAEEAKAADAPAAEEKAQENG